MEKQKIKKIKSQLFTLRRTGLGFDRLKPEVALEKENEQSWDNLQSKNDKENIACGKEFRAVVSNTQFQVVCYGTFNPCYLRATNK